MLPQVVRWSLALLLACLLGCSQEQIVGFVCPGGGCEEPPAATPPLAAQDCSPIAIRTSPVRVDGPEVELCWVYSLKPSAAEREPLFITSVTVTPALETAAGSHHIDIRLIDGDELDPVAFPDGELEDCAAIWERVDESPLYATENSPGTWSFGDAPLMTTTAHRVMINQHYLKRSAEVVEVDLPVEMGCTYQQPPFVTQAFAFVREVRNFSVGIGEEAPVCTNCSFEVPVQLRRLFRRTHQIASFAVWQAGRPLWAPGTGMPCRTDPNSPWRCEFDEPLTVTNEETLHWACLFRNDAADVPIMVGEGTDACSLMGHYSLPSGDAQDPQGCRRKLSVMPAACDGAPPF